MTASQTIDALRTSVRAIEVGEAECLRTLSFGSAQADEIFSRTFLCGRAHEIGGSAATLFAALVLGRCEGPTLWCAREGASSALYPPGLAQTGFDPDRLVLVRLRAADDLLHAAHTGLRAGWHVVLEGAKPFDLSAARRLQLACEAGGGLGFVLAAGGLKHDPEKLADFSDKIMRPNKDAHDPEKLTDFSDKIMRPNKDAHDPEKLTDFSDKIMRKNKENASAIDSNPRNRALHAAALLPSATTRWQAAVAGGALWPRALRLKLHLLRNRTGLPGQWTVEWDYGSRSFSVVSASCDRPADTPRAILA